MSSISTSVLFLPIYSPHERHLTLLYQKRKIGKYLCVGALRNIRKSPVHYLCEDFRMVIRICRWDNGVVPEKNEDTLFSRSLQFLFHFTSTSNIQIPPIAYNYYQYLIVCSNFQWKSKNMDIDERG